MSHSIIIIGAGAAGLMAASKLLGQGHEVTILESQDRVGGRIHTLFNKFSLPAEIGAEFMHGELPLTSALLKEANIERIAMTGKSYQVRHGEVSTDDYFDKEWDELKNALKELKTDTDIASFLNSRFPVEKYHNLHETVTGFVEGYDAADMHRVSAFALREEWAEGDEATQYHIKGGYANLINHLKNKVTVAGGKIALSSAVEEVEWKQNYVAVKTQNGNTYHAEKVIVTVPLGVLQKGVIRFSPEPDGIKEALSNRGFGGIIKFLFEFKEAFWEKSSSRKLSRTSFVFSDAEIPTWWTQLPDKTPLLTGWLAGPKTFRINDGNNKLYEQAVKSLAYIFKCDTTTIESELTTWHIANWVTNPNAFGAYAYATVNGASARKFLSTPIYNTIYFAGEALYDGPAMGTVEAALCSGNEVGLGISPTLSS